MLHILNRLMPLTVMQTFMPQGQCYLWQADLIWLHASSDLAIALAYYSISVVLFYLVHKRRDLPFDWIFMLFAAFIVACGTTHLLAVWTLWHPTYWVSGLAKAATASISLYTAVRLVPLLPTLLALPHPSQLEAINQQLRDEIAKRLQLETERQRFFQLAPDLFCITTLDGKFQYVNSAWESVTGLSMADLMGRPYQTVLHADDQPIAAAYVEQLLAGLDNGSIDARIMHQDGTWQWFSWKARVSEPDQLIYAVGRNVETTKQAEAALRESEERFRHAFDYAAIGMGLVALNGRWLKVNSALCDIVGYPEPELLSLTFQDITHPDDLSTDLTYVKQLQDGDISSYQMEKRYFHKQGHIVWILLSVSMVHSSEGTPLYFISQIQDITARKQADTALQESERRFRAIFDCAFQFIGLLTPAGILLEANQTALAFGGLTQDEVVNRPFWEAGWWIIDLPTQQRLRQAIAQAAAGNFIRYEVDVLGADGTAATIDFSLKPVYNDDGEIVLLIPEGRDVSDRVALRQKLADREARLTAFFTYAPVGMAIMSPEFRFVQINEPLAHINALSIDDHLGQPLSTTLPTLAPVIEPIYRQIFATGQPVLNVEIQAAHLNQAGTTGYWLISCFPMFNTAGKIDSIGVVVVDITDRKQAELELRSVKDHLEYLLTSSPTLIFSCDIVKSQSIGNYPVTFISKNSEAIFGFGPQVFSDNPDFWFSRIHPDDVPAVLGALQQLSTQDQFSYEYRFLHADNTYRWMYVLLQIKRDDTQPPTELLGYVVDITDRKQAEIELQSVKDRLEYLLTSSPSLIYTCGISNYLIDQSFRVTFVSENSSDIYGFPSSNFVGEDQDFWAGRVHPDDLGRISQSVPIQHLDQYSYDYRFLHSDNTYHWMYVQMRIVKDDHQVPVEIIGHALDVTERKQAELELESVKNRLQYLLTSSPAVIFSCTPGGSYKATYISDNVATILGYSAQDFLNDPDFWVNRVHPDDIDEVISNLPDIFKHQLHSHEYRFLKADGSYCWLFAQLQLSCDAAGRPTEIVGYLIDISKRKQAEIDLMQSLQEKEVLLKEIHHRVKNNLQIVYSLLRLQSRRTNDPKSAEILLDSQARIKSIALIHEKLYQSHNLAKINYSQYITDLISHLYSSYKVFPNVVKIAAAIAPHIQLDIDTAIPCGLIINELISNSLKHAFPDQRLGEITVAMNRGDHGQITLVIRDNGIGFPPDIDIDRCPSLGLRLVRDLTRQLQGTIAIRHIDGTEFEINFPSLKP